MQVDIYLQDADSHLPKEGSIIQDQCHTIPEVMAAKLDESWSQFWCRDSTEDFNTQNSADDSWSDFQQWLDATPEIPITQ